MTKIFVAAVIERVCSGGRSRCVQTGGGGGGDRGIGSRVGRGRSGQWQSVFVTIQSRPPCQLVCYKKKILTMAYRKSTKVLKTSATNN